MRGIRLAVVCAALCAAGRAPAAAAAEPQPFEAAALPAVKLLVRGEGWLRVTQPELVAAGLDPGVDPARLQLWADGVEQPIEITGNGDATFDAAEALEFYGVGRDTLWTDTRTYWLTVGAGAGAAGLRVAKLAAASSPGGAAPSSFVATQALTERKNYVSALRNGDASNFFGAAVSTTPLTQVLTARHLDAAGAASLGVTLQGISTAGHQVAVSLNGAALGTCAFTGQALQTCTFAAAGIVEGDNQIGLHATGAAPDISVVQTARLDYPHTFTADGDALKLTAPAAATRITVDGFTSAGVRVVDVTDPARPVELAVTVSGGGGATRTTRVDTPAGSGPRTLLAFGTDSVGRPFLIAPSRPSSWWSSSGGDLVILSHAAFMDALQPLVARRAREGWAVQLVDLQDVYDEFGGGDKSAGAVRDFLGYARAHWPIAPRFVLLVGDASFDPRNFLGKGDFDFAPTKLVDTQAMETASDDWFVDWDGDALPDIAVGRFPVRTADEASVVVRKTLAYAGAADLPRGGLFVTDQNDVDLDFESASEMSAAAVAGIMPVESFKRSDPNATGAALLAKLNAGPFLVNYLGHGSVEVWDQLLASSDARGLSNEHKSVYVIMNCLNGFFHDLYTESMAEALLKAPQGGAVAVWASSTLASFDPQPLLDEELLSRLSRTSLGEAAMAAKGAIADADARRTWILFGDPTLFATPPAHPDAAATTGQPDAGGGGAEGADAGAADSAVAGGETASGGDGPVDSSRDAVLDAVQPTRASGGGCACAVGASHSAAGGWGAASLLLLLALAARARRRRARRPRARARAAAGRKALWIAVAWLAWLGFAPSAHAAYSYRKSMTIDRARIGNAGGATTLSNYPILVSVTDAALETVANGGHVQNASGYDITFVAADTATCGGPASCTLNYEIETYVASTGQIVAWVQIPSLNTAAASTNTVIYVMYGDATISSPTATGSATWDTHFKAVYHLQQNPAGAAPQMTDSTTTAASATASNGPLTATGNIGAGVSLDGVDDYLDYTTSAAFDWPAGGTFTYSGWFKTSDTSGPLLSQRGSVAGNPVIDIGVGYDGAIAAPGKVLALVRDDSSGSGYAEVVGSTSVSDGAWHFFTVTRSAGTIQLYVDGVSQGSNTGAGAAAAITTNLRNIGREGNWVLAGYGTVGDRFLAATLDEYHVSDSVRSGDWIVTDYNTQSAPASTFTISGEGLASCGDGLIAAGESCDDGNFASGDGCSVGCAVEPGFTCAGMPSACATTCGDGVKAGGEQCDDHNTTNLDGCSASCNVEGGYFCTGSMPSVCAVATFDFYKTITIDRTKVGTASAPTTLANYPMLFSVTDSSLRTVANGGRMKNANAFDMIFRGDDTATCGGAAVCGLPHEIEKYDATTGQLIAWVRIPALNTQTASGDTSIHILFGNGGITTTSEMVTSVWDASFKAVWHLHQDPTGAAPQMRDSTSNGNHGTSTALTRTAGTVGSGVALDGATSYMDFSAGTSLNVASGGAFTYSGWVNTSDAFGGIFSTRSSSDGGKLALDLMVGFDGASTSSGSLLALVRDDTGGALAEVVGGTINNGAWHYVTLTRSGSTIQLYMDAMSQGTNSAAGSGGSVTSNLRGIGRESRWVQDNYSTAANEYLSGTLDEFRASSTVRSADWIVTDYNSQLSPSTFISYTTGSAGEVATTHSTGLAVVSFDASEGCDGTRLEWRTGYEVDNLGYNVYRDVGGGDRTRVNADLVYGSGLNGAGSDDYQLFDAGDLDPARRYWLEDVSFDGSSAWYGPVAAVPAMACAGGGAGPAVGVGPGPGPEPSAVGGGGARDDGPRGCALGGRGAGGGGPLGVAALVCALALARTRARARRRGRR